MASQPHLKKRIEVYKYNHQRFTVTNQQHQHHHHRPVGRGDATGSSAHPPSQVAEVRLRLFPFRKRSLSFLTVDSIIGDQAFSIEDVIVCSGLCYNLSS